MDSEKILKYSERLKNVDVALGLLNSGSSVKMEISNGAESSAVMIYVNPDDTSSYALSEALSKALAVRRSDLEREITALIR